MGKHYVLIMVKHLVTPFQVVTGSKTQKKKFILLSTIYKGRKVH